jgi:hypothetical protein
LKRQVQNQVLSSGPSDNKACFAEVLQVTNFRLYRFTGVQVYSFTGIRFYKHTVVISTCCTSLQFYRSTVLQFYNCSLTKRSLKGFLLNIERRRSVIRTLRFPRACSDGSPKEICQSYPRFQISQSSPIFQKILNVLQHLIVNCALNCDVTFFPFLF